MSAVQFRTNQRKPKMHSQPALPGTRLLVSLPAARPSGQPPGRAHPNLPLSTVQRSHSDCQNASDHRDSLTIASSELADFAFPIWSVFVYFQKTQAGKSSERRPRKPSISSLVPGGGALGPQTTRLLAAPLETLIRLWTRLSESRRSQIDSD